jgi:hypothetical protein
VARIIDPLDSGGDASRMTEPLRRAHFWIWVLLPAILAIAFVAGLAARRNTTPANPGVLWETYK